MKHKNQSSGEPKTSHRDKSQCINKKGFNKVQKKAKYKSLKNPRNISQENTGDIKGWEAGWHPERTRNKLTKTWGRTESIYGHTNEEIRYRWRTFNQILQLLYVYFWSKRFGQIFRRQINYGTKVVCVVEIIVTKDCHDIHTVVVKSLHTPVKNMYITVVFSFSVVERVEHSWSLVQ